MLRHIPLGKMWNLRDLGGYPTADGRITRWERLLRGDTPLGLGEEDVDWLLDREITTVVDLRSAQEAEHRPCELRYIPGFTYHHCALAGGEILPNTEADVGVGYFKMLDRKDTVREALGLIAAAPGGVLFHCTAGKDRTGCTAALLLSLAGVGRADILADYQVSETYIMDFIRAIAAKLPDQAAFIGRSKAEYMETCLGLLAEKYGAVEDYLLAAGLGAGALDALRAKLLDES